MSDANLVLFALLGGTALLLYGVRLVGEGLQRAAGTRLRHVLSTLTGNRFKSLLVGAGVTAVLQSSSATTVMLVGFASAGLLTLRQTIGMILGADIGTTVTVQLLAFDLLGISPLVVFAGWLLYVSGRGTARYVGQAILGCGFLFLGMKLIHDGTAPLATSALFRDLLGALTDQPLLLVLISALFTALVRSSAAVIGLALSLATSGLMPLVGAIPIIFGANVGTAATAVLAAVGQNAEARRVAAAHAAFKVVGVVIFFPFIGPFAELVRLTSPDLQRQIANAHTIFNVALALVFLPFAGLAADLITRLIPEVRRTETGPMYLNPAVLDTPAVALGQALREVLRMGDVVLQSLRETRVVLERDDIALMREIIARDDLIELAEKKIRGNHVFSAQGWREIADLHAKVVENLELAMGALPSGDREVAEKVIRHKGVVNTMERQLRAAHIQRLHEGLRESIDTSSIHLDLLASFKRANSLVTGIAYAVLGQHDA